MSHREQIFSEIVRDNRNSIYRICLAYLYDRSYADDLYQEILLQIWSSLDSYSGAAKMSTWVYRVAMNTAITYNSLHKKNRHHELPDTVQIADENPAPQQEQRMQQLYKAISMLEEQDRLIISLVLEDVSYKEIAEITGSNVNNTGVRINRIKTRLMKLMDPKNDER